MRRKISLFLLLSLHFSNLYKGQRINQSKISKDSLKPLFLTLIIFPHPKNYYQFCKMYVPPKNMKIGVLFRKVNNMSFVIHPFPNLLTVNSYIFEIFCNALKSIILKTKIIFLTSFIISLFCYRTVKTS